MSFSNHQVSGAFISFRQGEESTFRSQENRSSCLGIADIIVSRTNTVLTLSLLYFG